MSDLQIGLLAIGALVIAGVYLVNWRQQRKFRRRTEEAFRHKPPDVLYDGSAAELAGDGRVEPLLRPGAEWKIDEPGSPLQAESKVLEGALPADESVAPENHGLAGLVDGDIDYVAEIRSDTPMSAAVLEGALQRKFDFGKPVHWVGLNRHTGNWEEIQPGMPAAYSIIRAGLQLTDRAGTVSEARLSEFRDMVQGLAADLDAEARCPDLEEAHAAAALLDQFCAEVDVMIGLNVVSRDGAAFTGTKIRALAESAGFKLEPEGEFKYLNEHGEHLFSLCNQESRPFLPDEIKHLTTRGITFLLDVPRVARAERAFDHMVQLAKSFSGTLGGALVDDNRTPLNDAGISTIRGQVQEIQHRMNSRQISAGSPRALRLFA